MEVGGKLMLVISTAYEFLSLITFTLGLCIATLAALKSFTRISPLSNRVEPIYILPFLL